VGGEEKKTGGTRMVRKRKEEKGWKKNKTRKTMRRIPKHIYGKILHRRGKGYENKLDSKG